MEPSILQPLLEGGMAKYSVPGAQLGLLRGAERVVVSAELCDQGNTRPAVDATAFHAGSLAKALTGLLILNAARNGDSISMRPAPRRTRVSGQRLHVRSCHKPRADPTCCPRTTSRSRTSF